MTEPQFPTGSRPTVSNVSPPSAPPPPSQQSLPSAPPLAAGLADDASTSASPEPPRRRGSIVVAAVVAVALLGGALTYFVLRSGTSAPSRQLTALRLAFDRGDETTYDIHISMNGSVDLGALGQQPMDIDIRETVGWKVVDVDDQGVATVRVSVEGISGSTNGQPLPGTIDGQSMTLRVTRDGQILEANGLSFGSTGGTGLGGFPGMDQVTPILPDHAVAPGDEWDKEFSQSFPFGDGKIEYTAHSTFERYDTVGGVRAAVVRTTYTVPLDFSVDLNELAKAFGGSGGSQLPGLGGKDATIDYGGSGTFTQTSWLDLAGKQVVQTTSNGDFDMTMSFPGLEEQLGTGDFAMSATFSMQMTRR
jgi:hypothetical protein